MVSFATKARIPFLGLFLVLLASSAKADYGHTSTVDRNWTCDLRILGVANTGELVSGTKPEFTVVPYAVIDLLNGDQYWTICWVTKVQIWVGDGVGGEKVYEFVGGPANPFTGTAKVRWASTWFAHDLTVPIKAKIECNAKKYTPDGHTQLDTSTVTLEVTVEPQTYNHAVLYATVEKVNTQGAYEVDETHAVPVVAKKLINDVSRPMFLAKAGADGGTTGKAHKVSPGTWALEKDMRETVPTLGKGLDKWLKESTVFWICSHGENTVIRASHTDELTTSEVYGYVQSNRTLPKHNLAVLYSCWTNTYNFSEAFQTSVLGQIQPDRAFVGFQKPVDRRLVTTIGPTPVIRTLDLHAQRFLERLLAGDRVVDALENANSHFMPGESSGNALPTIALEMK